MDLHDKKEEKNGSESKYSLQISDLSNAFIQLSSGTFSATKATPTCE